MAVITIREALKQALREEMIRDERVFLMGEDIGPYGGAFAVTKGLIDEFGEERVRGLLVEQGLTDEDIALINADVERQIKEIVAFAETSPAPDFSTLYDYTYAEPEHQAMIMPVKEN